LLKILFSIVVLSSTLLFSAEDSTSKFIKQRIEIRELKKELNEFYNTKEAEYKQRKKELEDLLSKIEKEKDEIQKLRDQNLEILQDIKGEVKTKTAKIYNKMKPKVSAEIFNKMIDDGNINEVFDIILKLKEKNVTLIMRYLSIKNASQLTLMFKEFNDNKIKG
jgi:flagellar motility protein MotE (MotC chaperone)